MKKAILIAVAIVAAQVPSLAPAEATYNVLLAGGSESNTIRIWISEDGRDYVIDSMVPLEVGGSVCVNPNGNPNELICPAPPIAGFEVNADGGDDKVSVSKDVAVPVTMRGGSGRDQLRGGKGPDKLIGGNGNDRLVGWWGDDLLAGGNGDDVHLGGPGDDVIFRGNGDDVVRPGGGDNVVRKEPESPGPEPPGKH
jgi:Ca2+-binding RTX toxin-like protein